MSFQELAAFLWSVADLLRGDYKQSDYGKVILPFTLLRRLDCVLDGTKDAVRSEYLKRKNEGVNLDIFLKRKSKQAFYNVSPFTLPGLLDDQKHIRQNLVAYIGDFSADARDVFERFRFIERIAELEDKNLLYMLVQKFAAVDLHPDRVPNETMGLVFEELIRRFAEASNETAGEHFTPREVIKLLVHILFAGDDEALSKPGVVRSLYDPTAGTGGMLSVGQNDLREINPSAKLVLFGQELNDESYAICKADMLIKGQDPQHIVRGNTLSHDAFPGEKFDYMLSNPPFGVEWKKVADTVRTEHEKKGFGGRFGPGLPRISDGSMLFLLHLISKMRPAVKGGAGGSRIGIVLNGSPLFTGDAGSGESEIRRYILENDLLDAIIALPTDLFYNTGIATYVWVLDNTKAPERKGQVQLIDATRMYAKMKKSLGNKRVCITDAQIDEIVSVYSAMPENATFENEYREPVKGNAAGVPAAESEPPRVVNKRFPTTFFGYRKVTVDRPPQPGAEVKVKKGQKAYDPELRDTENVPLDESIEAYFKREVLPHVPDAWVNTDIRDEQDSKTGKVGYEINFNRHFYVQTPQRRPQVVARDIQEVEKRFLELMKHRPALDGRTAAQYRLKYLAEVRPSNIDKHSSSEEPTIRLCNYVDVYKNEQITADIDFMEATASEVQINRFTLEANDVLITKDSEEPTDIGVPAYVPADLPGVVCGYHLALLRPNAAKLSGRFLHWALQTADVHAYFSTTAMGISRYALGVNDIGMTPLNVPTLEEQERVARFLSDETARIDALIAEKERLVDLLTEYRKSLTGR